MAKPLKSKVAKSSRAKSTRLPKARAPVQPQRPRRSSKVGYATGAQTRLRLIAAAIEVFARHGLKEASTRMIARRAGVNLPALHYYFGGKEGLYYACAEHIAQEAGRSMVDPITENLTKALKTTGRSKKELRAAFRSTLNHIADQLVGNDQPPYWAEFLMRERENPTAPLNALLKNYVDALAIPIGRLIDRPADDPETLLHAFFTIGQMQAILSMRSTVLGVLGWRDFDADRLDKVKAVMWRQISGLAD